jgi:hypothetical protein
MDITVDIEEEASSMSSHPLLPDRDHFSIVRRRQRAPARLAPLSFFPLPFAPLSLAPLLLVAHLFLVAPLLLAGCDETAKPAAPNTTAGIPVPDFRIVDVNPNSATYTDTLSPDDFAGKISAWYFGHAT